MNIDEYYRTMKLDQLQYFLETAKTQHIGKAARILHVSPSAISHSISSLEEELGLPLFDKVGKSICLNAHGRSFAQKITPIIDSLYRVKDQIQAEEVELDGSLRLAATHGLADSFVTPALVKLAKLNPKLVLEFYSQRSVQVVEGVIKGDLDFGVCFAPIPSPLLTTHILRKERLVIAVKRNHPLCKIHGKSLLKALSDFPQASPKAFHGIEICENHPALQALGIQMNPSLMYDSYDVGVAAISSGNYWSLIPEIFLKNTSLVELNIPGLDITTTICAITPKSRPLPRAVHQWLTSLIDVK